MKFLFTLLSLGISLSTFSQTTKSSVATNWQLLDWQIDGFPGISVEKAYRTVLLNKKPLKRVLVAIIDDGMDSTQPDLAGMQWTNTKEIPGNGIDDDHNGYVDDVHGWNFVGETKLETFEEVREYVRLRSRFENIPDSNRLKKDPLYSYWKTIVDAKNNVIVTLEGTSKGIKSIIEAFQTVEDYWKKQLSTDSIPFSYIKIPQPYPNADSSVLKARDLILSFKDNVSSTPGDRTLHLIIADIQSLADESNKALGATDSVLKEGDPALFRKRALGDDPYLNQGTVAGNNNTFPQDTHGTQCAGVVAALRDNDLGGKGITNSVMIMPLRINAMGHDCDEWDKDVANAIRYAADNGAQVISMSFGKIFSPQKKWVENAVAYAAEKGVLIIHAAGNSGINNDSTIFYPQEYYSRKSSASNMITVGASTYDSSLIGSFSNYGPKTVDVFAPGVSILMPTLHGKYESGFGTSFACPMVAGLAAFLWSYYPDFTYKQIRSCIERSAVAIPILVSKPGTDQKVPFASLSRTGGIVNAYDAFLIAEKIVMIGSRKAP